MYYLIPNFFALILGISLYIRNSWAGISFDSIVFHVLNHTGKIDNAIIFHGCVYIAISLLIINTLLFFIKKKKWRVYLQFVIVLASCCSLFDLLYRVNFIYYIKGKTSYSRFIDDNYIDPANVDIKFNKKRNLIFIFLESMENTYADKQHGGLFQQNYIPMLNKVADKYENFRGGVIY